jgi:hypothetical protein
VISARIYWPETRSHLTKSCPVIATTQMYGPSTKLSFLQPPMRGQYVMYC